MTSSEERKNMVNAIQEAVTSGARLKKVCTYIGLSIRTFQRWVCSPTGKDNRKCNINPYV